MSAPAHKPNHLIELVAGAIAAAIGMFTAIHLGLLGTIAGSVVMSIISTAGIAVFGRTLQSAGSRLRVTTESGQTEVVEIRTESRSWRDRLRMLSWRRASLALAGAFVLSMSVLTFVETVSAPDSAAANPVTPTASATTTPAVVPSAAPTVTATSTATQTIVVSRPTVTVIEAPPVTVTATVPAAPTASPSTPGSANIVDIAPTSAPTTAAPASPSASPTGTTSTGQTSAATATTQP